MPLRPRHPLARSCRCKLPGVNRPVRFNERFHRGLRTWCGNGGPGIPVVSGQIRIYEWPGRVRNVATKSPISLLGLFVPEWAAQGAKAQIPGRSAARLPAKLGLL